MLFSAVGSESVNHYTADIEIVFNATQEREHVLAIDPACDRKFQSPDNVHDTTVKLEFRRSGDTEIRVRLKYSARVNSLEAGVLPEIIHP